MRTRALPAERVLEDEVFALGNVEGISFHVKDKQIVFPITFTSEQDKTVKMRILMVAILLRGAFAMKAVIHITEESVMDIASAHRMIAQNLRGFDIPFNCAKVPEKGGRYIAVSVL